MTPEEFAQRIKDIEIASEESLRRTATVFWKFIGEEMKAEFREKYAWARELE